MTKASEQNNPQYREKDLAVEQRRLQAAVAARQAVLAALHQERDRLLDKIGKARSGLWEAESQLARIRGQSSKKISTD